MRTPASILLLLSISSTSALAECECLWKGSFADVQSGTEFVASGTVVASKGNSIDLEVDDVLRGEDALNPIRVWLKAGSYCRPDVALFPVGSRWVMALERIDEEVPGGFNPHTPNISYGRVGDYSLSSCGGYWLRRHGDFVTGNLVNAPRWVDEPEMSPVLFTLVAGYVQGNVTREALSAASTPDPALRQLKRDTNAFLRDAD